MLRELEHFVVIASVGTFTAAARRVHLSQPALTASVQRLEQAVGATLLRRGRQGAELTAAGQAFLPRAQAALAAFRDGQRAVAEIEGLSAGQVRLGGGATACTYLLPPLLARFRRRRPSIGLVLREGTTTELEAAVEDGTLDLAVISLDKRQRFDERHQRFGRFTDDELIVVAAPSAEPLPTAWITFTPGSPTRALLLERVPQAQLVMELSSIAAVKGNVRAGIGLALISRAAVAADLAHGSLVEVPQRFTPLRRRLAIRHRGRQRLPPAAAALLEVLAAA
ncbi:MAG: LysR family transcriptional regulator [Myxococcales bacterium]|nr:LysR family transcriptional regulator [Myxococcales bacterium]